jgi:Ca-activated chloride channel homolog
MNALLTMLLTMWAEPGRLWLLLLVPAVIGVFVYAQWRRQSLLARLGNIELLNRLSAGVSTGLRWFRTTLYAVALGWIVIAAARPQWGRETQLVDTVGLDLVILLDTSLSMLAQDVAPDRLAAAKQEIGTFVERLTGDRVAIVPFAGSAFVQCPLTTDYSAIKLFLSSISTNTIATPGTDIARAIRTGHAAFVEEDGTRHRAMILVTDGEGHELEPVMAAAQMVADAGIRIYAIGIGSPEGELIPIERAGRTDFLRDSQGNVVKTRLDEATLQQIAVETDGAYYRASPDAMELEDILEDIDELERSFGSEEQLISRVDRFQWPLGFGVILLLIVPFIPERRMRGDG